MELYGKNEDHSPVFKMAVGSGFRDFTRIAAGNPAMWEDIVDMNSAEIRYFLSRYRRRLEELEKNLEKRERLLFWRNFLGRPRPYGKKSHEKNRDSSGPIGEGNINRARGQIHFPPGGDAGLPGLRNDPDRAFFDLTGLPVHHRDFQGVGGSNQASGGPCRGCWKGPEFA